LHRALPACPARRSSDLWTEVVQGVPSQVKLLVTVGSPAFSGLAEASAEGRLGRTPLLATLLPRSVFEAQRRKLTGPVTAIVLDQDRKSTRLNSSHVKRS